MTDVDARSDIWSLGAVLFELITGQPPFFGESLPQLCVSVLGKPVPALAPFRADVPPELDVVLQRCLAKDRANRYRNVAELAHALAMFAPARSTPHIQQIVSVMREAGQSVESSRVDSPVPPTPAAITQPAPLTVSSEVRGHAPPPSPRRRMPLSLIVAALASLGAVGLFFVMRLPRLHDPLFFPAAITVSAAEPTTATSAVVETPPLTEAPPLVPAAAAVESATAAAPSKAALERRSAVSRHTPSAPASSTSAHAESGNGASVFLAPVQSASPVPGPTASSGGKRKYRTEF